MADPMDLGEPEEVFDVQEFWNGKWISTANTIGLFFEDYEYFYDEEEAYETLNELGRQGYNTSNFRVQKIKNGSRNGLE